MVVVVVVVVVVLLLLLLWNQADLQLQLLTPDDAGLRKRLRKLLQVLCQQHHQPTAVANLRVVRNEHKICSCCYCGTSHKRGRFLTFRLITIGVMAVRIVE